MYRLIGMLDPEGVASFAEQSCLLSIETVQHKWEDDCGTFSACKQQGITIVARPAAASTSGSGVVMSPVTIFTILTQIPDMDMQALGFIGYSNHPCNGIIMTLPVLPPVSRPSMRTIEYLHPPTKKHLWWWMKVCVISRQGNRLLLKTAIILSLTVSCYTTEKKGRDACITVDYQTVLTSAALIRNSPDRNVIWQRYMEMHMAIAHGEF